MSTSCPNCGNRQNPPGAVTCRACGQSLSGPLPTPTRGSGLTSANPVLVDPTGRRYNISVTGDTYVGSRGCAIPVAGSQVLPRHARLFVAGGCLNIEAQPGAQVLVNNISISGVTALQPRDLVTIGSIVLAYIPGSSPLPSGQAAQPVVSPHLPVPSPTRVPAPTPTPVIRTPQGDLEGDVVYIDGPYMEEPDMTTGRFLGRMFGFMLAMWKPVFIMLGTQHKQVPVRYVRVEDLQQQIRVVKMKGEMVVGMIGTGDHVVFWGRWQGGTLLMNKGYNQTTNSAIGLRQ